MLLWFAVCGLNIYCCCYRVTNKLLHGDIMLAGLTDADVDLMLALMLPMLPDVFCRQCLNSKGLRSKMQSPADLNTSLAMHEAPLKRARAFWSKAGAHGSSTTSRSSKLRQKSAPGWEELE